jgi:hypothetical protein
MTEVTGFFTLHHKPVNLATGLTSFPRALKRTRMFLQFRMLHSVKAMSQTL